MLPYVLCKKYTCPKADICFRLRASPNEGQTYSEFIGLCDKKSEFRYFMKIQPKDKVIDLNIKPEIKTIEIEQGDTNAK